MGLFDVLRDLGNPTKDWPTLGPPSVAISLRTKQLEALRFGEPIDAAQALGKPDVFAWTLRKNKDCKLLYASSGLELEFQGDRFVVANFFIAPTSCDHPAFKPALTKAPDGTALTSSMNKARLADLFGPPDDHGSDRDVVQIRRDDTIFDFFMSDDGTLDSWRFYLLE